MANSRYDYHKQEERYTDLRFNRGTYIIVRIDGDKFHNFSAQHSFHKPNDKRALDLMVESAKQLMRTYKGHIPLAYGHSDEFSFLIKCSSNILSRRLFKITSMLPVVFATSYNSNWYTFFGDQTRGEITTRKYDAWFDARPKEYPNYRSVIEYFKWRQIDCHINNLYNTTLHAMTGHYIRHELEPNFAQSGGDQNSSEQNSSPSELKLDRTRIKRTPISEWISDTSKFFTSRDATDKLSGTISSDKHDIMFLDYKINYNNELEQFKKGTVIVDTQRDFDGGNPDHEAIQHYYVDLIKKDNFWEQNRHIFDDLLPNVKLDET